MSGTQMSVEAVRKWHALAERRRRHYVELYRSDKWRRHYSEEAFAALMRDVIQNVEVLEQGARTDDRIRGDEGGLARRRGTNAASAAWDCRGDVFSSQA